VKHRLLPLLALVPLVAGMLSASAQTPVKPATPPNIVFILADDLGWADTTPYGSTYFKTPNIARLAKRGMLFTNGYAANPLCSPTRASVLTGQYPARIGITAPVCHLPQVKLIEDLQPAAPANVKVLEPRSATRLKTEYITTAEVLKTKGYATGHFGKWHLGSKPYSPLQQGFDVDIPHWWGPGPAGSYVAPWKFPPKLHFLPRTPHEHIEDRMADEAVAFINAHKSGPFFLNYWSFSVHAPYDAKENYVEYYRTTEDHKNPQHNPVYAAMVRSLDEAVGKLLDTLDADGLTKNTVVVFFSDNGGVNWNGHGPNRFPEMMRPDSAPTSNAPLRGGKATIYEGGIREPCIVSWPGNVRPNSRSTAFISSVDWFPTLLEIAGAAPPAEQILDGVSQTAAFRGTGTPRQEIYTFFPHKVPATGALPATSVRQGDWKLIRFHADGEKQEDRFELYNLQDDIGETKNLASQYPEKVRTLNALIGKFLAETHAVVPIPNPAYRKGAIAGEPAPLKLVAGWAASKDAALSVKGGMLTIVSTGRDPFLAAKILGTTALPAGEYTVELRMKSTAPGQGQVFWRNAPEGGGFRKENSVTFDVKADNQLHDYAVKIKIGQPMNMLRLDPAEGIGEITVESLQIKDAAGKVVSQWQFNEKGASK
jgi:arylsulfatase A-like enzyme